MLCLATAFLLFCATRRRALALGPIEHRPAGAGAGPGPDRADDNRLLAAALALWVLLPPTGIGFFAFAAVFAAALGLGVLSHIPGGLGVFEVAILYAVGGKAPPSAVVAALVAYRGDLLSAAAVSLDRAAGWVRDAPLSRRGPRRAHRPRSDAASAVFSRGDDLCRRRDSGRCPGRCPPLPTGCRYWRSTCRSWAVETAHLLASIAGLVLLFAARGLLHRLDGAWWLALSMTLLSIPFCLVKGLAIVAPTAAALLLVGLIAGRAQFDRRASLLSQPMTVGWLTAIGCVVAASVWILFFAFRHVEYHASAMVAIRIRRHRVAGAAHGSGVSRCSA